jgi:hypothetical protein
MGFEHPDVRITIPATSSVTPEQEMELLVTRRTDRTTPLAFGGNTSIRIGQVRELERRMVLRPFEGHGRVEIVVDADRMTLPAANALLKTLEEPPDGTLIILLTTVYTRMLPTIRSRAHLIRLCRIQRDEIESVLRERRGADPGTARKLAAAADGSIGKALLMLDGGQEEGDGGSSGVMKALAGCSTPSEVSILASGLAKELGRDGLLSLCRDARSLTHDRRRLASGRTPLGMDPEEGVLAGLDDPGLDCMESAFRECEKRLRGNVMPSMALHAALARCWIEMNPGGLAR